jgi:predicted aldo/keto reductase-like oxidoreductase
VARQQAGKTIFGRYKETDMKRRSFLKAVGGATGGLALGMETRGGAAEATAEVERVAGLPRRILGRTGQKLSVVGFPGLALIHYDQPQCTAGLRSALERGVNYFDVAPAYGNGQCETKMGIGLEGVDRSSYFLACKTKKRDKAGAREELEQSLKLLKTDHFDLYQLHHLRWKDEVDQALGPDGAIQTLVEAQKEGKIKYLGFSAHTTKAALRVMQGFRFDTVMFPINFVEYLRYGMGKAVIELARQQEVAVLSIKAMSRGGWPTDVERTRKWWYRSVEEPVEVDMAMRFALSQPGVVAAIPPSFLDLLDKAIEAGKTLQPITGPETERLNEIAQACPSIFQKDETQAHWHHAPREPRFARSPHEGCCGPWA